MIASDFILKFDTPSGRSSQLWLLPLCAIANKYNPTYPYAREVYRNFCELPEEKQTLILDRADLKIRASRCDEFFISQMDYLREVIKNDYPDGMDKLYKIEKYLEKALKEYGPKEVPSIFCVKDTHTQECCARQMWNGSYGLTMDYDRHIENMILYEKNNQPITRLFGEPTSMRRPDTDSGILASYLCCKITKYVACYSSNAEPPSKETGFVTWSVGNRTMEDLFLESLLYVYCHGGHKMEEEKQIKWPAK